MTAKLWFEQALLPEGWRQRVQVTLGAGHFAAVTCDVAPDPAAERHAIALPGMPNLHSHAFQRAMAGLTEHRGHDDDSFWTWREAMYHFVERLDPDALIAIAALAYVEMLEGGFTHVAEFHYLHHDVDGRPYADRAIMAAGIAAAANDAGIGLTLLPVFYAHGGFGGAPIGAAQRRFHTDVDGYAALVAACRAAVTGQVGIAPHSLRAATPEELVAILPLAGDAPVHIHIAEQRREVAECEAALGARPVEWLLDRLPVDHRWCLVHATHLTEAETQTLARSGAVAGLCPITEANLGDGLFPALDYRAQGGRIGIGSDSNVRIDATAELCLLEYGQRLAHRGRNLLADGPGASTGGSLYRAALAGGAAAVGAPQGIAVGNSADFVTLAADHVALIGRGGDALLDAHIFGAPGAIDRVWQAGRCRVTGGRHDAREAVERRYRAVLSRLLA